MTLHQKYLGKKGEQLAQDFLKKQGFNIIANNFYSRFGEIDIVAKKGNTLSFIEVKTRIGDAKGNPYEAVTFSKLKHLKKAVQYFLITHPLYKNHKFSVSVASIILHPDESVKKIDYFEGVE